MSALLLPDMILLVLISSHGSPMFNIRTPAAKLIERIFALLGRGRVDPIGYLFG
jgi:hypothetical protein